MDEIAALLDHALSIIELQHINATESINLIDDLASNSPIFYS